MKPRPSGHGGVANPRDATGHRCALRLVLTRNASISSVPPCVKQSTRSPGGRRPSCGCPRPSEPVMAMAAVDRPVHHAQAISASPAAQHAASAGDDETLPHPLCSHMLAQCTGCGEQGSMLHSCGHRSCAHSQHHEAQVDAPRFLPTVDRLRAVALHFARCEQLAAGLSPTRMRPCRTHAIKKARQCRAFVQA